MIEYFIFICPCNYHIIFANRVANITMKTDCVVAPKIDAWECSLLLVESFV